LYYPAPAKASINSVRMTINAGNSQPGKSAIRPLVTMLPIAVFEVRQSAQQLGPSPELQWVAVEVPALGLVPDC
jgi:hypothetical protein